MCFLICDFIRSSSDWHQTLHWPQLRGLVHWNSKEDVAMQLTLLNQILSSSFRPPCTKQNNIIFENTCFRTSACITLPKEVIVVLQRKKCWECLQQNYNPLHCHGVEEEASKTDVSELGQTSTNLPAWHETENIFIYSQWTDPLNSIHVLICTITTLYCRPQTRACAVQ